MKVLVVGKGGREHALCWAIAKSPIVDQVYCAPGNGGTSLDATNIDVNDDDLPGLVTWAKANAIDLVVPGPEAPLVAGLADRMIEAGIPCFGPSAAAAQLEGSKAFTKEVLDRAGVPTARWERFDDAGKAKAYIAKLGAPIVVKADGLATGKGVTVAMTEAEAVAAVEAAIEERIFGEAGATVVIEEFLDGEEASIHVLTDGESVLPLATSQDHKRVGDGDTGPNTGGMGAYSPAPVMTPELEAFALDKMVRPTIETMEAAGTPFRGVLYGGLMLTAEGPKLLEYNVRFGDPETQAMLVRLKSDLVPALIAGTEGELAHVDLRWWDKASMTVVMATNGYPGAYEKGSEIKGLEAAGALDDVRVFHAGTKREGQTWRASGGRVLGVTALGDTIAAAQKRAYEAVDLIDWPGGFCRRDIGWRAL
jgi:phosphoribosylamine--glycine ligase